MPRYALRFAVDGTGFAGTAIQPGLRTVQGELRRVAEDLGADPVRLRLASRLDAGVDARDLAGHCDLPRTWEPAELVRAFNGRLPRDVAAFAAAAVPDDWDVQRSAGAKTYAYRVLVHPLRPVFDRDRIHHRRRLPDPGRLEALAARLPGRHDLAGFACLRGDPSDGGDPERTVHAAAWTRTSTADDRGEELVFRITAAGFLYKQVRGLVGAMLAVASGSETEARFDRAMHGGRGFEPRVGDIAPASGLCLERVAFDPEPDWTG